MIKERREPLEHKELPAVEEDKDSDWPLPEPQGYKPHSARIADRRRERSGGERDASGAATDWPGAHGLRPAAQSV